MSNTDDFNAIKKYFTQAVPKTANGATTRTTFLSWAPTVSTLLGTSDKDLSTAKLYRDQFNGYEFAKAVASQKDQPQLTDEEKDYFVNKIPVVNTTGMTAEQAHAAVWTKQANAPAVPASLGGPTTAAAQKHATIRQGSKGQDVKDWQAIIGIKSDGVFGAQTATLTKTWQKNHGLKDDGVVGPATWSKAYEVATPMGQPMPSTDNQVAAATGASTVPHVIATVSKPAATVSKPAATAATGAKPAGSAAKTTVASAANTFQEKVKSETKAIEASMLSIPSKMPAWAWAGAIGAVIAGIFYTAFGKPKAKKYF
jgi:peptidoglycan hydrolase-like protein with peptidoglycan-binding domain